MANRLAKKYGPKLGASRFVAGEQITDAVKQVQTLNDHGMAAMLNYLGEFVRTEEEAKVAAEKCLDTLDAIYESGLDCNLTVKPTSLGLGINHDIALSHFRRILERAAEYDNFVRIEAEDYVHWQMILDLYKKLRLEYDNVGTVVQAYLYRVEKDIEDLNTYDANLRLVKGAYNEPPDVAFPHKKDVNRNYEKMIKLHLLNGNYAGIATHDENIIRKVIDFTKKNAISKKQFEFQMLYGIRPELQWDLARDGYKVRVYVPYGSDWFGYFMRRLAERPDNVVFVLKNLYKK
jgi:proline dehydrogenase